ncbi:hypothetical protein B0H11DRAFT_2278361 [Mycena galericulata]|nr:hypothetical protein B0H11DRAFT_2278361 [Mycena galericulata]
MTSMTSGGKLPIELERLVFEFAAETRSTIPNLILVAQRVRVWLEPLLYRVLQLSRLHLAAKVIESVQTKPPMFLASTVRHVLVYASYASTLDPGLFIGFLESCLGITSLSVLGSIAGPHLLPVLGNMRIQRLSVDLGQLFRDEQDVEGEVFGEYHAVDMNYPLFAVVSHLEIYDGFDTEVEEPEVMQWLRGLSALPALTHLALNSPPHLQVLSSVLGACPRIDALLVLFPVVQQDSAKEYLEYIGGAISDSRFVVVMYKNYYADWELGARGGSDVWARADDFIARKKRGEVQAGDYFLDDSGG